MKRANIYSLIFFTMLVISSIESAIVYPQIEGTSFFDVETCQFSQKLWLGDDFKNTQQFSLWGYIQPNQNVPAISNIASLFQNTSDNNNILQAYQEAVDADTCTQYNEIFVNEQKSGLIQDLVSINYELNSDLQTFNIGFTYQDNGEYKYKAIENIPRNDDVQTYFGFSGDYKNGNVDMYVQTMDGSEGYLQQDTVSKQELFLDSNDYLIVGGTNQFLYTTVTQYIGTISDVQMGSFFIDGQTNKWNEFILNNNQQPQEVIVDTIVQPQQVIIDNVYQPQEVLVDTIVQPQEQPVTITQDVCQEPQQMQAENLKYQNILLDLQYNVMGDEKKEESEDEDKAEQYFVSKGYYGQKEILLNKKTSKSLYRVDNNRVGVRYRENAQVDLGCIDFSNQNQALFYFDMQFSDDIGKEVVLLTRGNPNQSGFIQIVLQKEDDDRIIRMYLQGDQNSEQIVFDSPDHLSRNKRHRFMIGVYQLENNKLQPLYVDLQNNQKYGPEVDMQSFNFGPQKVVMFNPQPDDKPKNDGYVNMNRFIILNTVNPALYYDHLKLLDTEDGKRYLNDQEGQCLLSANSQRCLVCQNSILNQNYQCVQHCNLGFKNGLNDVCVECKNGDCTEIDQTVFRLTPRRKREYYLQPTRTLLGPNRNFQNNVALYTLKDEKEWDLIEKSKYKTDYDEEKQRMKIKLDDEERLSHPLNLYSIINYDNGYYYDRNRNIVKTQNTLEGDLERPQNLGNVIIYKAQHDKNYPYYYCITTSYGNRGKKMRILAYILLLAYAGTALLLLLWTLCCWKRFWDLGGLWKFLLHHWMKLNLVAFFILLAINMPCCVREFLHQLYKYVVSWDHELRHWINNVNDDSRDYREGFIKRDVPFQFRAEHVRPFILHNLLITFIAQLAIFAIYMVLKLWDYCNVWKKSCLFRWLIFWEFTALIVGYLLFHMRDFVFSALNWRKAIFSHSYFVCCFLIAIFYVLVFWLFWLYSAVVLLSKGISYWSDITNVNKFYYFFVGYRNDRLARTYDHWVTLAHFVVAMMIGLLIYSPRAQMIVIVSILGLLFIITILLRPWKNFILLICDLLAQVAILLTVIFFLIYAIQDHGRRCHDCYHRESAHCWIIVLFLFIALMLGLLGLLAAIFMDCCKKDKKVVTTQQDIYHYNQENEIITNEQNIYTKDRNVYENVHNQNVVMGGNMMGSERVVNQQVYENSNMNQGLRQDYDVSKNVQNYNTSTNHIVDHTNSVNRVHVVQPDVADDGHIQNEMIHAMHNKSHGENVVIRDNLHDNSNQFYNRLNKDSNVGLYQAKNLGDNEHVFNDEVKVTKYTKTTQN